MSAFDHISNSYYRDWAPEQQRSYPDANARGKSIVRETVIYPTTSTQLSRALADGFSKQLVVTARAFEEDDLAF